jgi:hypothetical protein
MKNKDKNKINYSFSQMSLFSSSSPLLRCHYSCIVLLT